MHFKKIALKILVLSSILALSAIALGHPTPLKQNLRNTAAPEILVFVSWSMAINSLKQWMNEADALGVSLNVRGLIAEDFSKSILKMQKFVKDNDEKGGIDINPEYFERYDIQKVPAVVVVNPKDDNHSFDVVYGTSTIKEALELISESNYRTQAQAQAKVAK